MSTENGAAIQQIKESIVALGKSISDQLLEFRIYCAVMFFLFVPAILFSMAYPMRAIAILKAYAGVPPQHHAL